RRFRHCARRTYGKAFGERVDHRPVIVGDAVIERALPSTGSRFLDEPGIVADPIVQAAGGQHLVFPRHQPSAVVQAGEGVARDGGVRHPRPPYRDLDLDEPPRLPRPRVDRQRVTRDSPLPDLIVRSARNADTTAGWIAGSEEWRTGARGIGRDHGISTGAQMPM